MVSVYSVVDSQREVWLPRKRTDPFAILVNQAPHRPTGQFHGKQGQACIGPGSIREQPIEVVRFARLSQRGDPRAYAHDAEKNLGIGRWRCLQPIREKSKWGKIVYHGSLAEQDDRRLIRWPQGP